MADVTLGGRPVGDARASIIQQKRTLHQIHALENTVEKYEIDILEAEANIARQRESIEATETRIQEMRDNLAEKEKEG